MTNDTDRGGNVTVLRANNNTIHINDFPRFPDIIEEDDHFAPPTKNMRLALFLLSCVAVAAVAAADQSQLRGAAAPGAKAKGAAEQGESGASAQGQEEDSNPEQKSSDGALKATMVTVRGERRAERGCTEGVRRA